MDVSEQQSAHIVARPSAAPLRGTQSFVTVMAAVWKRPGLTGLEAGWRWAVGVPLLWLLVRTLLRALGAHPPDTAALEAMTVFQPVAAVDTLRRQAAPLWPPLVAVGDLLLPAGLLAYTVASTAGRVAISRRLEPSLPLRRGVVALFSLLRLVLLLGFYAGWLLGLRGAALYSFGSAGRSGAEPNLVLLAAMAVAWTLLLFLLWSLLVWPLDAAPLFTLVGSKHPGQALRCALRANALRSRLVEINLVMGIVKVGLSVLALVFAATPLPFSAEESRGFLIGWWSLVGVLYLLALDFFHVVRRAANLSFFQTLESANVSHHP